MTLAAIIADCEAVTATHGASRIGSHFAECWKFHPGCLAQRFIDLTTPSERTSA